MSFFLSKEDIIFLHSELINIFGGSDGIRDEAMLGCLKKEQWVELFLKRSSCRKR